MNVKETPILRLAGGEIYFPSPLSMSSLVERDEALLQLIVCFATSEFEQIVDDRLPIGANAKKGLAAIATPAIVECILRSIILAKVSFGTSGENIHLFQDRHDDDIKFGCPMQEDLKIALNALNLEEYFDDMANSPAVADMTLKGIVKLDGFRFNDDIQRLLRQEDLLKNTTRIILERLLQIDSGVEILSAAIAQLPMHLLQDRTIKPSERNVACDLSEWWNDDFLPGLCEGRLF